MPQALAKPPLKEQVETLVQIRTQDLEPDPQGGGSRIREEVAADRRISIADKEMRHGRKSKRLNGFKRHIAADVDRGLILACAMTPANRPEDEAMPSLPDNRERQGLAIDHLLIDRGYINSPVVDEVLGRRGNIVCKPWTSRNRGLFPKSAFTLNIRDRTVQCPDGQVQGFSFGTVVEFDPDVCDRCARRAQCTTAELGTGRSVAIAEKRTAAATTPQADPDARWTRGTARAHDDRTHTRPHLATARYRGAYRGVRKNTFDLRRASAIQDLETLTLAEVDAKAA